MIFLKSDIMGYRQFIDEQKKAISEQVGDAKVICALSGGVDSSVATVLAHEAGVDVENFFIDDYLRKKDEYAFVRDAFAKMDIKVGLCDIKDEMMSALEGVSDNTQKRPIFRRVFYDAFGKLVREKNVRYFLQGTIKADRKMYAKGQLQHNVDIPFGEHGIEHVVEPLVELYKPGVRNVARLLDLPPEISVRAPFPGPGLLIRCLGEVTREKVNLIREGLAIAEEELAELNPFQVVVAVSDDKVCSMIDRAVPDKYMLIVRAVRSKDAMTAEGIVPSQELKDRLEERLISLGKVGRVLWDPTNKPPGTIEYI